MPAAARRARRRAAISSDGRHKDTLNAIADVLYVEVIGDSPTSLVTGYGRADLCVGRCQPFAEAVVSAEVDTLVEPIACANSRW